MAIFNVFKNKEKGEDKKEKQAFKNVLRSPYFTEKSALLEKKSEYIFKVLPGANKTQIKKAVENDYDVPVASVRIINVRRKKKRLGKHQGWKKGFKKAIVKLKEGKKIDLLSK